jgi:hypothetical protein
VKHRQRIAVRWSSSRRTERRDWGIPIEMARGKDFGVYYEFKTQEKGISMCYYLMAAPQACHLTNPSSSRSFPTS